jgi:hypothetical protein
MNLTKQNRNSMEIFVNMTPNEAYFDPPKMLGAMELRRSNECRVYSYVAL